MLRALIRIAIAGGLVAPVLAFTPASADLSQCAPITIGGAEAACIAVSSSQVTDPDGNPGLELSVTLNVFGLQPITKSETVVVPVSTVEGFVPCVSNGRLALPFSSLYGPYAYVYGIGRVDDTSCWGNFGIAISPTGSELTATPPGISTPNQLVSVPYHVPQICITTSPGACVGPYDGTLAESVPVPHLDSPPSATIGDPSKICLLSPDGANGNGQLVGLIPFLVPLKTGADGTYDTGEYDDSLCTPYIPVGVPTPQGP